MKWPFASPTWSHPSPRPHCVGIIGRNCGACYVDFDLCIAERFHVYIWRRSCFPFCKLECCISNIQMAVAPKLSALLGSFFAWSAIAVASQSPAGLRGGIIGVVCFGKVFGNSVLERAVLCTSQETSCHSRIQSLMCMSLSVSGFHLWSLRVPVLMVWLSCLQR